MKNRIFVSIVFIFLVLSCKRTDVTHESGIAAEIKEEIRHNTLTFVAVGDNLFHDSLIRDGLTDGVYNFSSIYSEVKNIIQDADLAFINQETVMAGTSFGYSGFPLFNTPQSLARTLADTGFDIVNLANNHAMDMGRAGLHNTIDLFETIPGITVIGVRKEGPSARIIVKNNIVLGFLAYTFSLNGIPLPADNPNLVSVINRERMSKEINELRPFVDFLIVSMHWGAEYLLQPDADQTNLARFLAEHNVDLIIGHHPHVLQKVETITLEDGRKTLCYYSLGNFASHQRQRERIIGGMLALTFSKTESNLNPLELSISDSGLIPVITHYDNSFRNTKVYPLWAYTEELLEEHGLKIRQDPDISIEFFNDVLERIQTKIIMFNPFS